MADDLIANMPHPDQPRGDDGTGILRFKANKIVRYLLDAGPFDLESLGLMPFSIEDQQQFAQLIGYSIRGYCELPYVTDEAIERLRKGNSDGTATK